MRARIIAAPVCLLAILGFAMPVTAVDEQPQDDITGIEAGEIQIDGITFDSWDAYYASEYFRENVKRCAAPSLFEDQSHLRGSPADCSLSSTNPAPEYEPTVVICIDVVVHIIMTDSGVGDLTDERVQSQMDVLNEDFQAILGTPGEPGYDVKLEFRLAPFDPDGSPTSGITRTLNSQWYSDSGAYYNVLAWDPHHYLNIYTMGLPDGNPGVLGYVPFLPQQGGVGSNADRVVILNRAFGRPGTIPPYNLGRTTTHEVGHYLGLFHTFQGGCGSAAACYTTGDRICDTNPEVTSRFGCPTGITSCSPPSPDPIHNYMDYTDDLCMWEFTHEQARRVRCTIDNYRVNIPSQYGCDIVAVGPAAEQSLYSLHQNRPNPFNPTTEISFELAASGLVSLEILDVTGRVIRNLAGGRMDSGLHRVSWDGTNADQAAVASGVYFYRLKTDAGTQTRRMILLK
jgi:hypothetical protein